MILTISKLKLNYIIKVLLEFVWVDNGYKGIYLYYSTHLHKKALKLLEQMTQNQIIPNRMFQSIIEDYRGKIDFQDFSCYDDSKTHQRVNI